VFIWLLVTQVGLYTTHICSDVGLVSPDLQNAKFHCKIRLETSEDEDEFLDFYAFPSDDKGADAADDMDTDDVADASGSASKAGPAKQKQQQQQQQVLVIGQPAASALITEEEARRRCV